MLMQLRRLLLLIVVLSTTLPAIAQDSSSMRGVVTDSTGAVIPGVTATLSKASTGVQFARVTDEHASYRFASVPANSGYRARCSHSGFSAAQVSDITLAVSRSALRGPDDATARGPGAHAATVVF
jgi:hypothetical protein